MVTRVGDETVGEMWSLFDGHPVFTGLVVSALARPEWLVEVTAFGERDGDSLGDRLVAALQAGLAAGGEVSPVRSAGMVMAESVPWPVTDLRVDWHEDPVGELARLWQLWRPQAASYVRRALHPAEAVAGVGEQPPGPFGK